MTETLFWKTGRKNNTGIMLETSTIQKGNNYGEPTEKIIMHALLQTGSALPTAGMRISASPGKEILQLLVVQTEKTAINRVFTRIKITAIPC